nr:peptidoglycan-binding domain-containing protein [Auraticoccus cholistanensis]
MKAGAATGAPVRAVQKALKVPTTGSWDTATRNAVKALQKKNGLTQSGNANTATWRALLAAHAPR